MRRIDRGNLVADSGRDTLSCHTVSARSQRAFDGLTILVVGDHRDTIDMLQEWLGSEGTAEEAVREAEQAVEALQRCPGRPRSHSDRRRGGRGTQISTTAAIEPWLMLKFGRPRPTPR